jgi:osomolarity two-component system response regulator SKN7
LSQGWQFKHPEFTKDSKDNLDNIRRKAPASRKQQQQFDESGSQQIEQLQEGLRAMQNSQQELGVRMQKFHEHTGNAYQDMQLAMSSQAVYIHQHEEIIKRLLSVLSDLSAQVRALKQECARAHGQNQIQQEEDIPPGETGGMSNATSPANQQSGGSPLQQAQRLMEGYRNLQRPSIQAGIDQFQMAHQDQDGGGYDGIYSQNGQMLNLNGHGVDQPGQHMFPNMGSYNNGPPPGQMQWHETPPPQISSAVGTPGGRPTPGRKRSTPQTPHWRQSPRVLLVEDDPTCRRIGSKFLSSAQCMVDVAVGLVHPACARVCLTI